MRLVISGHNNYWDGKSKTAWTAILDDLMWADNDAGDCNDLYGAKKSLACYMTDKGPLTILCGWRYSAGLGKDGVWGIASGEWRDPYCSPLFNEYCINRLTGIDEVRKIQSVAQ